MDEILTSAKASQISISAVVTRANGRVENYGTVAYYHRNPIIRCAVNASIWLKRKVLK